MVLADLALLVKIKLTKFEWTTRCQRQFARRLKPKGDEIELDWQYIAEICYDEMFEGNENDPEGSANEELSCWGE